MASSPPVKVGIKRFETGPLGTYGDLNVPGVFQCYTLERPAEGDHPCIPAGTYAVRYLNHPEHGWCYEVTNVKDRTAILIHAANWWDQLLGCIAPGRAVCDVEGEWPKGKPRKTKGVSSSGDALKGLVAALERKDFELTISWAPGVGPQA